MFYFKAVPAEAKAIKAARLALVRENLHLVVSRGALALLHGIAQKRLTEEDLGPYTATLFSLVRKGLLYPQDNGYAPTRLGLITLELAEATRLIHE